MTKNEARAHAALKELECTPQMGWHTAKDCPKCQAIAAVTKAIGEAVTEAVSEAVAPGVEMYNALKGMEDEANDILANDDPDGKEGKAARALLEAIAKAEKSKP
jgi:hypothetical protein